MAAGWIVAILEEMTRVQAPRPSVSKSFRSPYCHGSQWCQAPWDQPPVPKAVLPEPVLPKHVEPIRTPPVLPKLLADEVFKVLAFVFTGPADVLNCPADEFGGGVPLLVFGSKPPLAR